VLKKGKAWVPGGGGEVFDGREEGAGQLRDEGEVAVP
jgi:hypothetical protein